jgi:hypothetical protein
LAYNHMLMSDPDDISTESCRTKSRRLLSKIEPALPCPWTIPWPEDATKVVLSTQHDASKHQTRLCFQFYRWISPRDINVTMAV